MTTPLKGSAAPTTFGAYLAALPEDQRAAFERIRTVVHATVADVEEDVAYGLPAFLLHKKPLLYIGATAKHCAIYGAVGDFAQELAKFDVSKGTIRFEPEKPLPVVLLAGQRPTAAS